MHAENPLTERPAQRLRLRTHRAHRRKLKCHRKPRDPHRSRNLRNSAENPNSPESQSSEDNLLLRRPLNRKALHPHQLRGHPSNARRMSNPARGASARNR
jgi:hypothetical protein